jgi:2-iminobutanoate/2-iminopropanoate deaminase
MRSIETAHAPRPAGHYAQGIVHGGLVYVAGQLPLNPVTLKPLDASELDDRSPEALADAQTERTLRNVEAVLAAAGTDLSRVLSATVYVTGRYLWTPVNEAFARVFGSHKPARAIVPVPELKPGCLVEIQVVAALPGDHP